MRKQSILLAAASLAVAGLSIGCDNSATVKDPPVYRTEPMSSGINDPVRVSGAPIGANRTATPGVVGSTPATGGGMGAGTADTGIRTTGGTNAASVTTEGVTTGTAGA